jgi:ParB family chromosome partitioning protein
MAKLKAPESAGWNAGRNFYAKPFRIAEIVIDPEISKIFTIQDKAVEEIARKMKKTGYDKSQPVVIWKGENILLDGHTRLAAAKELGLEEIPSVEMEFEDREDALFYTYERQVMRRNLTSSEILTAAQMIHGRKEYDGKGRAAEQLAERLGISPATVYQARKIMMEAPEEDLKAVQNGERSIKSVYNEITKPKKKRAVEPLTDKQDVPDVSSEDRQNTDALIINGIKNPLSGILTAIIKINAACRLTEDPECLELLREAQKCLEEAMN